jgi:hypothetical protein
MCPSKAEIVREFYARTDAPGVVLVFECDGVEQCKRYTDDFLLTKAGYTEWFHLPVQVAVPLEVLFRTEIDVNEPYDRTIAATSSGRRDKQPQAGAQSAAH